MRSRTLLLASIIGLGVAPLTEAATQYVYVTGSTAARNAFFNAVTNGTTVFDAAPTFVTQGNADPSKATYMNLSGNLSTVPTVIKCHWSGSEGGIADIAGSGTQQFLDDAAGNSLSSSTPGPFISSTIDLAMADNDKAFSRNPTANITGVKVCVIPFKWEKQKGSAPSLVNLTDQAFRQAVVGGGTLALFTGNSADTTYVYVSGRDNQSGTRVNEYGDPGFGIFLCPIAASSQSRWFDGGSSGWLRSGGLRLFRRWPAGDPNGI